MLVLTVSCSDDSDGVTEPDISEAAGKPAVQNASIASQLATDMGLSAAMTALATPVGKAAATTGTLFPQMESIDETFDFDATNDQGSDIFPSTSGLLNITGSGTSSGDPTDGSMSYDMALTARNDISTAITHDNGTSTAVFVNGSQINGTLNLVWRHVSDDDFDITASITETLNDVAFTTQSDGNPSQVIMNGTIDMDLVTSSDPQETSIVTEIDLSATITTDGESSTIGIIVYASKTAGTAPSTTYYVAVDGTTYGPFTEDEFVSLYDFNLIVPGIEELFGGNVPLSEDLIYTGATAIQLLDALFDSEGGETFIPDLALQKAARSRTIDRTVDLSQNTTYGTGQVWFTGNIETTPGIDGGSIAADNLRMTFLTDIILTEPESMTVLTLAKDGIVTGTNSVDYVLQSRTVTSSGTTVLTASDISATLYGSDMDPVSTTLDLSLTILGHYSDSDIMDLTRGDYGAKGTGQTVFSWVKDGCQYSVTTIVEYDTTVEPSQESITMTISYGSFGKTYGPYTAVEFMAAYDVLLPEIF